MYTLDEFIDSKWSFVVYHGDRIVFSSQESDLHPLMEYFAHSGPMETADIILFDRYIGRAAALLMTLAKPRHVYTGTISEGGIETLDKASIPFESRERVKWLMGVASKDMCRWEKLALGKTPQDFYDHLKSLEEYKS